MDLGVALTPWAVSLNGTVIAYAVPPAADEFGDARDLYLVQDDETAPVLVHSAADQITALSWNPEGSQLAFVADGRLRVLDMPTGEVRDMGDASAPAPARVYRRSAWSADGRWIYYSAGLHQQVMRIRPDGSEQGLFASAGRFALSPASSEVALAAIGGGLAVAAEDGSSVRDVAHGSVEAPAWRADAGAVSFVAPLEDGSAALCVVAADESFRELIACVDGESTTAWSPDGRSIAATQRHSDPCDASIPDFGLSVVDVETGAIRSLVRQPLFDPVWVAGSP